MKNKIVSLKDGRTMCRILDSIIYKGDTQYLAIEFDTNHIIMIYPKDIYDILTFKSEIFLRDEGKIDPGCLVSLKKDILRIGI